ncbi:TPA: alpha/beta fold hydrolase, partial [Stenotrophomonas maltophilia]|nr:alpha/beta fold hydrolase [Stenotrophomonas maltophilia]
MTPPVLLLHGIWNARAWVGPLAWRLRARGFQVHAFGYSSVFGGPDVAVPQLLERLTDAGPLSLVGHSLGGLLALEALRRQPQLDVQRVVCLGSPLRGSGTARSLSEHGWGLALGRSSELLLDGLPDWQGKAEVGLIAGSVPHGLGSLLGAIDDASDGTVALAETRLPGLA